MMKHNTQAGICAYMTNQHESALRCFQIAESIAKRNNLPEVIAVAKYNTALVYIHLNDQPKMLEYSELLLPTPLAVRYP